MRKRIFRYPALFLLASILLAVPALADLSLDQRQLETYEPYTLSDLAAARFAVYGLLPDAYRTPQADTAAPLSRLDAVALLRDAFGYQTGDMMNIPFRDVDEAYRETVSWAYSSGIVKGRSDTEFGTYHVTEQAFLTMLLNALGFQRKFTYAEAFSFAERVGLSRPLGISDAFSLGDAALYLQQVLGMATAGGRSMRLKMNIPADMGNVTDWEQVSFPAVIALCPASVEDALAQLELATHYLPDRVEISSGPFSIGEIKALYKRFSADAPAESAWYLSRITDEYLYADFRELPARYELTDEQIAAYDAAMDDLARRHDAGELSDTDFDDEMDALRITYLTGGEALTLRFFYNSAWELACDLDDAFARFEDEELSRTADEFYQKYVARARSPKDAVYRAKSAIINYAHYAGAKGTKDGGADYPDDAHSIVGFFKDGAVVCDGYASVFQYLMHRAGVPCVVCYGSTVSREDAENGRTNHAWNKVQIGGQWLNMDICWADTGWPTQFDLRDNEHYTQFRHWLVTHTTLV